MVNTFDNSKSLKQFYHLWFEYFRLGQSELKWAKKEHQRCSEWGDISSNKNFGSWWKDKEYIFRDMIVEKGSPKLKESLNLSNLITYVV